MAPVLVRQQVCRMWAHAVTPVSACKASSSGVANWDLAAGWTAHAGSVRSCFKQ